MTARMRRLLLVVLFMALTALALAALFRPLKRASGFHIPTAAEARTAEALFRSALSDEDAVQIAATAKSLGLVAAQFGDSAMALAESPADCRGRGGYVFRRADEGTLPLAITAPHRGADRHTGPIVRHLIVDHLFAAAAWNSAPRSKSDDCPHAGDVAHEPVHYFTSFAVAFAKQYPKGRIVQLHGFDGAKRGSFAASEADIIVSDGTSAPSDGLLDVADCLSRAFPRHSVKVYGLETKELGAETNAQGIVLRKLGFSGFVHLEMAEAFRAMLVKNADARALLTRCLAR